jgi:hypothetical protein
MGPRGRRALDDADGPADASLATRRLLPLAPALERTLRRTNAIENLNGLVGHFARHVRRWRKARMLVRWIAAGLRAATRSFRRLRGHRGLATLLRALDRPAMDNATEIA